MKAHRSFYPQRISFTIFRIIDPTAFFICKKSCRSMTSGSILHQPNNTQPSLTRFRDHRRLRSQWNFSLQCSSYHYLTMIFSCVCLPVYLLILTYFSRLFPSCLALPSSSIYYYYPICFLSRFWTRVILGCSSWICLFISFLPRPG